MKRVNYPEIKIKSVYKKLFKTDGTPLCPSNPPLFSGLLQSMALSSLPPPAVFRFTGMRTAVQVVHAPSLERRHSLHWCGWSRGAVSGITTRDADSPCLCYQMTDVSSDGG